MEIELNRFTPAEQATFRLRALYEQAGYRKYRASRFEEYALYQEYQRFLPDAQVITFTDLDGKLRAIKPDVTLSIAKTAQPAAGECKRFYYNEEVCRPSRESHTFQTIHQMGLESMGAVDADEQAAVVRLALQSLAALDVPTVLEISHMGYLTGLLDALEKNGTGCIAFTPLAQGLLTGKYLNGIPDGSRMQREGKKVRGLTEKMLTEANLSSLRLLNEMAHARGQTMAQMALSWLLKDERVTSVLIGASRPEQLEENVQALNNLRFSEDELMRIDQHVADGELNLWQASSDK